MQKIQLTQGCFAIVDDEDFDDLNRYKWHLIAHTNEHPNWPSYAGRSDRMRPRKTIYMHREILKAHAGQEIDHKDRNGLNNQKHNLRFARSSENRINSESRPHSSTFKGVYWDAYRKCWRAHIQMNRKQKHLGCFRSEIDAAREYDNAAMFLFGEFAFLNFPDLRHSSRIR